MCSRVDRASCAGAYQQEPGGGGSHEDGRRGRCARRHRRGSGRQHQSEQAGAPILAPADVLRFVGEHVQGEFINRFSIYNPGGGPVEGLEPVFRGEFKA